MIIVYGESQSRLDSGMDTPSTKDDALITYINNNQYPSYQDIVFRIMKDKRKRFLDNYTEVSHNECKMIYESIYDRATVRKYGEMMNERGGQELMWTNFYVICFYSPLRKSEDYNIRRAYEFIERYWDGIGNWRY